MEKETLVNLVICVFCAVMLLGAIVVSLIFGAWWNMIPGSMFGVMGYTHYVDDQYGITSVRTWLKSLRVASK